MRYLIGIDLGTTHCCVAYADMNSAASIQQFRIPQLVSEGIADSLPLLPSCCYLAAEGEFNPRSIQLPWKSSSRIIVGTLARELGAKVPTRLVQSAKSWLCHSAANRKDRILPVEAADPSSRISPVEATAYLLEHIRDAWNYLMSEGNPDWEFEQQEIVITVPASFDEVARALTAEAARQAGCRHLTFIEEPQAAFYAWMGQQKGEWQQHFKQGQSILVCDIGGGTTDFSLIDVISKGDELGFQRMAVGNHLLLGGDNMDLAVAHQLEEHLKQAGHPDLTTDQWLQLKAQARKAKEALLTDLELKSFRVLLQGSGSKVVKGSLATEISQKELYHLLVDGFFGVYDWSQALQLRRATAIRTMGLAYEEEPSITKQLALFLSKAQMQQGVDYLLFNGGAVKAAAFQQAIVQSLQKWFPQKNLEQLASVSLDLAVARGAVYYAKVKHGLGVRIAAGSARSYYLEVNSAQGSQVKQALVLLPRGVEEGTAYESKQSFTLLPNTPVAFHLYTSHVRLHDQLGDLVAIDPEEMHLLPPIHTLLRFGKQQAFQSSSDAIPVTLGIRLTEIGTLELWLRSLKTEHQWTLEFQLRSSVSQSESLVQTEKRKDETLDAQELQAAEALLQACFSKPSQIKPARLIEQLEELIQRPRQEWPPSLLRALATALLKLSPFRSLSSEYEARWWNLAGFLLRPGYGYPLDDFRMKELWKIILSDRATKKSGEVALQQWICWRRLAGGFNKGQQLQLASELLNDVLPKKNQGFPELSKGERYAFQEKIRTLASFELLEMPQKIRLGEALVQRLAIEPSQVEAWALGRVAARRLFVGSAVNVVPKETCEKWIKSLLEKPLAQQPYAAFLFGQLAQKSDYKQLNVSDYLVDQILSCFQRKSDQSRLERLLHEQTDWTSEEQEKLYGETLPIGLMLTSASKPS